MKMSLIILLTLFSLPVFYLNAQETAQLQKFAWRPVADADHYSLTVEKEIPPDLEIAEEGITEWKSELETTLKETEASFYFPPGRYRYRVVVSNIFDLKSAPSDWAYFEIVEIIPEIPEPAPDPTPTPPTTPPPPSALSPDDSPKDFYLSMAYAPLIPFFGKINDYIDKKFLPVGVYARLGFVPLFLGNFGFELEISYNNMRLAQAVNLFSGSIYNASLSFLAHIPRFNDKLDLNVRAGTGVSLFYDFIFDLDAFSEPTNSPWYNFIKVGLGANLYVHKYTAFTLGADFIYIFTGDKPNSSYIRPSLSFLTFF
jgi:hypothetical protein